MDIRGLRRGPRVGLHGMEAHAEREVDVTNIPTLT
jgi:hypothetical protein